MLKVRCNGVGCGCAYSGEGDGDGEERPTERSTQAEDKSRVPPISAVGKQTQDHLLYEGV
ncbi:unnamed protein product [Fusarium graminearum]|uniref:Uncharacterized protein n=1 Tax=Gibberella zeae TaxID=5518 RepID=A0A4E9EH48_GIBZA|nr:unnamed protein product [Fusarium graminearum]CAG1987017.1 unnamed protein product [Fusarium graminearum]CAG2003202.1 unnamed protein product [Fusarium graminearum]